MPYSNVEDRPYNDIINCVKCKHGITPIQHYVECDTRKECFHLRCTGIHGQNITSISSSDLWICKDFKNRASQTQNN